MSPELNSLSFKENPFSNLIFSFPGSHDDTLTRGLIKSCTCNSCKDSESVFRLYDAGNIGKSDVLSISFTVLFGFATNELSANAFERSIELSERKEREEEEEEEEEEDEEEDEEEEEEEEGEEDEIIFFEETSRGFVMTVLGGGPCLKCPLHADLKLSKLRTGFN